MKEKVISMAKKESQDGKSKKGLPRLMELAIYFIIQEIVGLTRISALWMCPKCWDMAAWLSVGFS